MSSKSTRTPRLDTDYTGALIPSPRDQDQRIWPGLHWASHQQAKLDSFDAWVRDKDVQVEQNERNMMALHRAQEAQVQLSDSNFWTQMEAADKDAEARLMNRRAVIEGPEVVNALRAVTSEDAAAREDMWRRHWDLHNAESQKRLDALHAAQDAVGHVGDHAVNNYRFYGPVATIAATGALLDREAAEEARRKTVVRRDAEDASSRLNAVMYHTAKADMDRQKALAEAAFWRDQTSVREKRLAEVQQENRELQQQFERVVVEDRKAREAERALEQAQRREQYAAMATKRAERKAAEDAADDTERQRRSEEEARHKADYKAVERQALEVEVEIKKKEMAVLSRIMSHQG